MNKVRYLARLSVPIKSILALLSIASIHLFAFLQSLGGGIFSLIDTSFINNFWLVFLSHVALSTTFGALTFLTIRGPALLFISYTFTKIFHNALIRPMRIFVAGIRRGWWDTYIATYVSSVVFICTYLERGVISAMFISTIPIIMNRTFIHAGDTLMYVASKGIREQLRYRNYEEEDSGRVLNRFDWRPYWRGAEDWADLRSFRLGSNNVYIFSVLLVVSAAYLGVARSAALLQRRDIIYEENFLSAIGPNASGIVVFDSSTKTLFLIDVARARFQIAEP